MTTAFIGVGSNVEPERHIPEALRRLAPGLRLTGVSTFYRTPPLGAPGTPSFVNGVVRGETGSSPRELKFELLRAIERELGRRRGADRNAPRTIDLDVLLHGRTVLAEPDLVLPDPDLLRRAFLARPLFELEPELVLPGSGLGREAVLARAAEGELTPLPEFTTRLRKEFVHEP